jgi:hypothetical protein
MHEVVGRDHVLVMNYSNDHNSVACHVKSVVLSVNYVVCFAKNRQTTLSSAANRHSNYVAWLIVDAEILEKSQ